MATDTKLRLTRGEHAYAILLMLTSGAFEKTPLRRSLLMEGEIKDERDTIKDALNMLERDGFIELRKERDEPRTRGGIPVCVFPGEKLRTP